MWEKGGRASGTVLFVTTEGNERIGGLRTEFLPTLPFQQEIWMEGMRLRDLP